MQLARGALTFCWVPSTKPDTYTKQGYRTFQHTEGSWGAQVAQDLSARVGLWQLRVRVPVLALQVHANMPWKDRLACAMVSVSQSLGHW